MADQLQNQKMPDYNGILESLLIDVLWVDSDGRILNIESSSGCLLGLVPQELVGKSLSQIPFNLISKNLESQLIEAMENQSALESEVMDQRGDWFHLRLRPSHLPSARGRHAITIRRITGEKQVILDLHEQIRRRDNFLATMSHELRNPAAAISNSLSILKQVEYQDPVQQKAIKIIEQQTRQLGQLLDDLLNVSRVAHNKFKLKQTNVNITQAAKQVAESLKHVFESKQQTLTLDIPNSSVYAFVDESRIIQAQTNLLVNASKYTPAGGNIHYSVVQVKDVITIEIKDDGEGMEPELLEKVFEMFVQSDRTQDATQEGMGLGLPLVKMIVQAHGGSVFAESPGQGLGSSFRITLPVGNLANDSMPIESNLNDQQLRDIHILLIEDNDGSRDMLAEFLRLKGLRVSTASTGQSGIDSFATNQPEICLVDIGLPDVNGYHVAERIRSLQDNPTLLVALTGLGQSKDREQVKNAGFDLHLIKPMHPEGLINSLITAFERNQSEDSIGQAGIG